jgi:hypothetical protein
MLIHEFNILSSNNLIWGWDEIVDTTSLAGYTFYGLAEFSAANTPPDTTKAVWYIYVLNNTTNKTRYYSPNQVWSTRASALTLP